MKQSDQDLHCFPLSHCFIQNKQICSAQILDGNSVTYNIITVTYYEHRGVLFFKFIIKLIFLGPIFLYFLIKTTSFSKKHRTKNLFSQITSKSQRGLFFCYLNTVSAVVFLGLSVCLVQKTVLFSQQGSVSGAIFRVCFFL